MTSFQRFVVEFDRRTVGIAVRVPGGFMFYASDSRFDAVDGQLFPRARAIERQLKNLADRASRTPADTALRTSPARTSRPDETVTSMTLDAGGSRPTSAP